MVGDVDGNVVIDDDAIRDMDGDGGGVGDWNRAITTPK